MRNVQINKSSSGFIRVDKDLRILEYGVKSASAFGYLKGLQNINLADLTVNIDEKSRNLLLSCFKKSKIKNVVTNCYILLNGEKYIVTVTPLSQGELLLSFSSEDKNFLPSENHYYWHFLHSRVISLTYDRNYQHIHISGPVENLFGVDQHHLLGKTIKEINIQSGLEDALTQLLRSAFRQEKTKKQPLEVDLPENNLFLKVFVYPEPDAENEIILVHLCITDYGELKKKNLQQTPANEQMRMALDASMLGIWEWSVIKNAIFFSRKWKGQLGYYPDELADNFSTFENLIHPADKDRILNELRNFLKGDSILLEFELRMRHKNGYFLWFYNRATCIRNASNNVVKMVGVARDITTEKQSGEELSLFKQIMTHSPVPIILTDIDGYIEFLNTAFCRKTGWNPEEIIGKKPNILKSGFHSVIFYEKLWQTIMGGQIWQGELHNKKKNGKHYIEFATILPLKNDKGAITHFAKITEDISILKKMESNLRKTKRSVEIASLHKSNFLANMNHKIRTPINGIIGFSDLLKAGTDDEGQQLRYINIIQESSIALLYLIDNIIDMARIEAGELKIKKESYALKDLFIELKPRMHKMALVKGKSNLSLNFLVPRESHHDIVFTDPIRLKQILLILFENALKRTETGFIEVGYQIYSERKLQFYIQDSGDGMSESQVDLLTRQFKTNETNTSREKDGIGIGLTICKGLVQLLDGQIGVKSKKKDGSIFYFMLPYDKIKVPPRQLIINQSKSSKYDFQKYTILIAEDVTYNFEYLKNIFASAGASILWAKDGIDVLNLFNSQKIDLILMDIQLPEIDGLEATRQIRQKNKSIPIIAQTGYTMDEDRKKCLAAGCNEVLIKPLKIEDVLRIASKYLKE